MVEVTDYGYVFIAEGEHQGKIGYYDNDDEGEKKGEDQAVVYLGTPCLSEYVLIPHEDLIKVIVHPTEFIKPFCVNCESIGDMDDIRKTNPKALSCCPERKTILTFTDDKLKPITELS